MTTDLDERITRALGARADTLTVTRPPLDDVLTGPAPVRAQPSGPRRSALLVAAAALVVLGVAAATVVATRSDGDGGRVDLRPAQEGSTTTVAPTELGLAYVPEDVADQPQGVVSQDGRATVLTYGSGDRMLEVTVVEATRSAELDDALDARDTEAIVAAYAAGGSIPAGIVVPPTPVAAEVLGPPAELPNRGGLVMGDVQNRDDPLLVVVDALPAHGQPIDVGLVAFREGAEVRISGHGLRLDEAMAVLAGIDGPGLAPRPRPSEARITAVPVAADMPFLRVATTALPERWALTTTGGLGGGLGGEDIVVGGPPAGAALTSSTYGRVGAPAAPDAVLLPGPFLTLSLGHSTPTPPQQAALASADEEALIESFDSLDVGLWASGGGARVFTVDAVAVLAATGVVDPTTVPELDGPVELTTAIAFLGPGLQLSVRSAGLTDDQLVAAIRALRIVV